MALYTLVSTPVMVKCPTEVSGEGRASPWRAGGRSSVQGVRFKALFMV